MCWTIFEEAKRVAIANQDERDYFLGAVGVRTDCAKLITACNGPAVISPQFNKHSYPPAHAEYRLARKLNKGSVVYVCRVRQIDGTFAMARPCVDCQRVLALKGIEKVYYTINNYEYGVMYLNKNWKYIDK